MCDDRAVYSRLALVTASVVAASVVGPNRAPLTRRPWAEPSISEGESPIARLDRCIQRRLHENPGFGISRLVDVPAHLHRFEPESSEESKAVTTLTGSGWSVWLRLAGRGLMEPDRTEQFNEQSIRRPIAVTDQELPVDTPRPRDLKQIAGRALALSGTADLALGSVGRWSVEARVVRADRKACVDCHSRDDKARSPRVEGRGQGPMKVGDALGVVIYVFTRSQGR